MLTQGMPGRYVLDALGAQPLSVLSDTFGFDDSERWEEAARIAFPRQRNEAEVDGAWAELKKRFHTDTRRKPKIEADVEARATIVSIETRSARCESALLQEVRPPARCESSARCESAL